MAGGVVFTYHIKEFMNFVDCSKISLSKETLEFL